MTKEEFLKDVANWDNHRHLLWPALEATTGDVVEMGMGQGSTPFLHEYCKANKRKLFSYDNNTAWSSKFDNFQEAGHRIANVVDWDDVMQPADVVLIDHAPGERRKIDIARFANVAKIIVCHDTEPAADHGYQMRAVLGTFKYRKEYQTVGAWATVVSNFVDVTKFEI
jgi:hypothetical protein